VVLPRRHPVIGKWNNVIESDGTHVENAIVARLSKNWQRRAAVKKGDPALEEFFDPLRSDYPLAMTPFALHPDCPDAESDAMRKALFLGALAFHRHTMVIEQMIVEPTFSKVIHGSALGQGGAEFERAVLQVAVDEQYHTLMHFNAADVMRQGRPWGFTGAELPLPGLIGRHQARRERQPGQRERDLVDLAFTTVVEISIDAYLTLVARDREIQPINSSTAAMHLRDEVCHASVSDELAKHVFVGLGPTEQRFFMQEMFYATEQFSIQDFTIWQRIVDLAQMHDGSRLLAESQEIPQARHLVRDNSGVHKLWAELNELAGQQYELPV
jgi:hypothetical protein